MRRACLTFNRSQFTIKLSERSLLKFLYYSLFALFLVAAMRTRLIIFHDLVQKIYKFYITETIEAITREQN